jgi:hypothetical protein
MMKLPTFSSVQVFQKRYWNEYLDIEMVTLGLRLSAVTTIPSSFYLIYPLTLLIIPMSRGNGIYP